MLCIRTLRKKKGMTQEQLADKVGVSVNTVWRWEDGRWEPNVYNWTKLYKVLETQEEWVVRLKGREKTEVDEGVFRQRAEQFLDTAFRLAKLVGLDTFYYKKRLSLRLQDGDCELGFFASKQCLRIEAPSTVRVPRSIVLRPRLDDFYWAIKNTEIDEELFLKCIIEEVFFS